MTGIGTATDEVLGKTGLINWSQLPSEPGDNLPLPNC